MEKEDFRSIKDEVWKPMRRQAIRIQKRGKEKGGGFNFWRACQYNSNWAKNYRDKGSKGLVGLKRGVKPEDKKLLTDLQEQHIQKMICDTMPDQLKWLMRYNQESGKGAYRKGIWGSACHYLQGTICVHGDTHLKSQTGECGNSLGR